MLLGTTDTTATDVYRETVEREDLGDGLARVVTAWLYRECLADVPQLLGICDGFTLGQVEGRDPLEVEIDRAAEDFRRRVHLLLPDGRIDMSYTAAQLLELARLLRRDEVFAALQQWAAEDVAADAAEARAVAEMRKGGR